MDCHLAVVEGLVCLRDPANSAGRGLASGRCNQAGKINGERPDKGQPFVVKHTTLLWGSLYVEMYISSSPVQLWRSFANS